MARPASAGRRIIAASAALALASAGVLVTASSAAAADADVATSDWLWEAVDDRAGLIDDAASYFVDYLDTPLDLYGFTDDAFDGFLEDEVDVTLGATTLGVTFTSTASDWVDFGLSEFTATASADFGDGDILEITRTLEVQGSFARWSWAMTTSGGAPLADYTIDTVGDLGSDGGSIFLTPSGSTMVSYEDGGGDPVIGYSVAGATYVATDGDEDVEFSFTADDAPVLTLALLEYDPCSLDDAITAMQDLLPTLAADFGDTLDPVYADDCLSVDEPDAVTGPTDQRLEFVQQEGLDDWGYIYDGAVDDGLTVRVLGAPAGLSFSVVADPDTNLPQLRMTGTPTDGGGEVRVLLYFADGDSSGDEPLIVTFDVVVELAATGPADIAPIAIGSAAVLVGLGALLLVLRRRATTR
ncbi:hypothetical protein [Microcella sp.]|uniref:hypothetical protein n=1 Tax=Microcella sp. TaxID=1913979 RepID=UPI003918D57A